MSLIISGPDFAAGHVEQDQIVSAVDLFATLSRWLRCRRPTGIAEDSVAIQTGKRRWIMAEQVGVDDELAIVLDNWKLRRFNGFEELYDLAADPTEEAPLDPLDPTYAGIVSSIRAIEASLPPRP